MQEVGEGAGVEMNDYGGIQYWQQLGQQEEENRMNVYQCINKVQAELAKVGISKDRECQQGARFRYRGIDEVYKTLAPLLSSTGLCILPRIVGRVCDERRSAKGGALFYVTVEAEFDFVSMEDGTKHIVRTYGEAMDSGDKATNKAMSIAYKNAIFMAFSVPTDGDNDPDAHAHEVVAQGPLPENVVQAHIKDISTARTIEALNAAANAALEAATDAKDRDGYKRLLSVAKDCKAALEQKEAA